MKRSTQLSRLAAIASAILFGILVLFGQLSSSDFPRGLFGGPYSDVDSHWTGFADLQVNLVYPTKVAWGPGTGVTLAEYLQHLGDTVGVVLEKGSWNPQDTLTSDSIPYLVKYHAYGQYNQLQVEWDSVTALDHLLDDGSSYYFFFPDSGTDSAAIPGVEGVFLLCEKDSCHNSSGMFVSGCDETETGDPLYEPCLDFGKSPGMFGYHVHGRTLVNRFRVALDSSQGVASSDTVLMYDMDILDGGGWTPHPHYMTRAQFGPDRVPIIDSMEVTVSPTYLRTAYKFYTGNKCDVYVDWVEYMDKEQAYPLVWNATTRAAALANVNNECQALLGTAAYYGAKIAGFGTVDGAINSIVPCGGILNDSLFVLDDSLRGHYPRHLFPVHNPEVMLMYYFDKGDPKVFDPYMYPFDRNNDPGNQRELDSLAECLERSYDHAENEGIDMVFMLQASNLDTENTTWTDPPLRNPMGSEILAESFMALAHGAKGISYYKWQTNDNDTFYQMKGLVTKKTDGYTHPDTGGYHEKWLAVQEIFTQLKAMGDTLLLLERVAAYCTANPSYQSPITGIHYEEEEGDTIEVGQFRLPPSEEPNYLILVNRRTNADRHITVETDKTGTWALRDLYTQEQFISSTGDFKAIPFDSGEGRVFVLQPEISLDKSAMEH